MLEGPERVLADIARRLRDLGKPFALVGGLAVSVRSEVRFTRDVDLALAVVDDAEVDALVRDLSSAGYRPIALVQHEKLNRLATVRLESPTGLLVDLLTASCGIEREVVHRATVVAFEGAGDILVASVEDLLAMKVLAVTPRRLQDRMDGVNLVLTNPAMDVGAVREALRLIAERGFDRDQDLDAKLDDLLREAREAAE